MHKCSISKLKILKKEQGFQYLKDNEINAVFRYIPFHILLTGKKYGKFAGEDKYATRERKRLVRLLVFYDLKSQKIEYIYEKIGAFIISYGNDRKMV